MERKPLARLAIYTFRQGVMEPSQTRLTLRNSSIVTYSGASSLIGTVLKSGLHKRSVDNGRPYNSAPHCVIQLRPRSGLGFLGCFADHTALVS